MASSLSRFAFRAFLSRSSAVRPILVPATVPWRRSISTTDKKKDGAVGLNVHNDGVSTKIGGHVDTDYVNRKKDWMTRGMDLEDEDHDRWFYYGAFFCLVTLGCITIAWMLKYSPNRNWPNRDWVVREAYLELHRREKFGLPLVDPDFIPRENIVLPSEEDLEDFDVTI